MVRPSAFSHTRTHAQSLTPIGVLALVPPLLHSLYYARPRVLSFLFSVARGRASEGSRRLDNAQRIALETEDVGAGILRNLQGQRSQLEHTRDTVSRLFPLSAPLLSPLLFRPGLACLFLFYHYPGRAVPLIF